MLCSGTNLPRVRKVSNELQSARSAAAQPKGLIFNVMRFSLNDGPGIRMTVFMKGCPLSCWWCHNPESQKLKQQIMFAADKCLQCGDCVQACTHGALTWDGGPIRDTAKCTECGDCAKVCTVEARQFVGEWITVEELMRRIRRDVIFFDQSGGGVTFSGGEPMMQPDFLEAALIACKAEGIHTTVDTCGYAQPRTLARIMNKVDLFLVDLKMIDPERHKKYTGTSNDLILANLEAMVQAGKRVKVRIPIIPGINDDDENIRASQEALSRIGIHDVDLLAYHQTGVDKYRRLQWEYRLTDVRPPSSEFMQGLSDRFSQAGFEVRIGG